MTPALIVKNPSLDFELCELLGEKPGDFIVLYLDGKPVPFTGTPYDSPYQRERYQLFVDGLNSRGKESHWPEFFTNWKAHFCHEYKLPVETKPPRLHRMMPDDVGDSGAAYPQYAARFKCRRCGTESEWLMLHTVKEIKRGIPCPKCNEEKANPAR